MEIFRSECIQGQFCSQVRYHYETKNHLGDTQGNIPNIYHGGKKKQANYPLWTRIQVKLLSFLNRTRKVPFTLVFFKGHSPVKVKWVAPRGRACPFLLCFLSQGTGGCLLHLQVPISHRTPAGFSQQKAPWDGEDGIASPQTASGGTSVAPKALLTMVPNSSWWLMVSPTDTSPPLSIQPGGLTQFQQGSPCCC